jgi:hypothetical protein
MPLSVNEINFVTLWLLEKITASGIIKLLLKDHAKGG